MSDVEQAVQAARDRIRSCRTLQQMEKALIRERDAITAALLVECFAELDEEYLSKGSTCPRCLSGKYRTTKTNRTLTTMVGTLRFSYLIYICLDCEHRNHALTNGLEIAPLSRISESLSRAIRTLGTKISVEKIKGVFSHIGIQISVTSIRKHRRK